MQVNNGGLRFSDEGRGCSEQAAVLRQPRALAWTVFDDRIAAIVRQFEGLRQAEAAGATAGRARDGEPRCGVSGPEASGYKLLAAVALGRVAGRAAAGASTLGRA